MLQTHELRVGNIVTSNRYPNLEYFPVDANDIYNMHYDNQVLLPVQLSEVWLIKFGFTKEYAGCSVAALDMHYKLGGTMTLSLNRCGAPDGLPYSVIIHHFNDQGISIQDAAEIQRSANETSDKPFILKHNTLVLNPIRYVHELQNLWFVTVGEELVELS